MRFFPNFLSLNRKMTKEFLPPFPIFRFIVQLQAENTRDRSKPVS